MRILIYTGKGGVGKTSIAAATAVRLAKEGKKVLLMSTDQAHSLGDSLCMKLDTEAREVFPGLEALEIDPSRESRRAWGTLQDYLRQLIEQKANGGIEADEVLLVLRYIFHKLGRVMRACVGVGVFAIRQ